MKTCKIKSSILTGFLSAICVLPILIVSINVSAQTTKADKAKSAQEVQKVKLTARKGRGRNDKNIAKIKTKKPKTRSRGDRVCNIEIKNNTQYTISAYVDDIQKGLVYSNKSFNTVYEIGRIKVYARTNLLNNNYLYWGPNYFTCGNNLKDGFVSLEVNPAGKN